MFILEEEKFNLVKLLKNRYKQRNYLLPLIEYFYCKPDMNIFEKCLWTKFSWFKLSTWECRWKKAKKNQNDFDISAFNIVYLLKKCTISCGFYAVLTKCPHFSHKFLQTSFVHFVGFFMYVVSLLICMNEILKDIASMHAENVEVSQSH